MTEVAKPVIVSAAWRAQRTLSAVTTTAVARMPNASAKGPSEDVPGRRSVAHHQLTVLEDQSGRAEHPGAIRPVLVDRDIRDSACTQVPPVGQAKQPRGRRAGHRRDLDQRIFAAY